MDVLNLSKTAIVLAVVVTFSACGGGGGGVTGPLNRAPVSNAGGAQSVDEFATVNLDGSASSDADGDAITFAWTQTAGTSVTITNGDTAQASFDAPDVTAVNTPDVLTFQLQVSDGTLNGTASVSISVNDAGLGANSPPTANAGGAQTVAELSAINLDGSGSSDPDVNDVLTYAWLQTAGPAVSLSDATVAQPSFTSPDVATPTVLSFQLTVDDGTDNDMATVDITVQETLSQVSVAGILSYEFALPNANCNGLNLDNPVIRPIRGVTVQLFDTANSLVLGTTVSTGNGSYSFANIDANLDVLIRVRAELKSSSPAIWDVELRDNVDTSASPPPLGERPLYVVDFPQFNVGVTNTSDADFTATTGWNGNAYTSPRLAAPFAILDAILDGIEMITAVDVTATFPPLDAFWSVNNTLTSPSDIDLGELSASFYRGDIDSLFLLGDASIDTEEFDDHVAMHEWAHYFEDNFSRSDSIGGPHTIGESLDPRLAFGEGFATALAAIALENPQYCDTNAPMESGGFGLDTENDNFGEQGFYNEMSVATLINDLWDTADDSDADGTDNGSIGFAPIYTVMTGPQRTTEAFTTLLSFATALRNNVMAADLAFVDSQLSRENLDLGALDIYGDGQTTIMATTPNGGVPRDILPVYTVLPTDGTVINICANSDFDSARGGNKLSERRLLRFSVVGTSTYDVSVTANPVPPATSDPAPTPPAALCDGTEVCDRSDPDVFIYRAGQLVGFSNSAVADSETFTTLPLPAGSYVFDLQEWRYSDDNASSDYPEQVCFDVSMGP